MCFIPCADESPYILVTRRQLICFFPRAAMDRKSRVAGLALSPEETAEFVSDHERHTPPSVPSSLPSSSLHMPPADKKAVDLGAIQLHDVSGHAVKVGIFVWLMAPDDPERIMLTPPGPWRVVRVAQADCLLRGPCVRGMQQQTVAVNVGRLHVLSESLARELSRRESVLNERDALLREYEAWAAQPPRPRS